MDESAYDVPDNVVRVKVTNSGPARPRTKKKWYCKLFAVKKLVFHFVCVRHIISSGCVVKN